MGTVDKLGSCVLGIQNQAERKNIDYNETSFILIEMGYGYNSILLVEDGKIVDGLGGTTNGLGFLTAGKIDLELAQLVGNWEKTDVFTGGASSISEKESLKEFLESRKDNKKSKTAWKAIMEDLEKSVASLVASTSEPEEILLSGRMTRFDGVKKELTKALNRFAPVKKLGNLDGADQIKGSAQGYAMLAEGLAEGEFSNLIETMKIREAEGTVLDHLYHPKGKKIKKELKEKISFRSF